MKTKRYFSAFMAAGFAMIYLPAEKVSAQAQDGNPHSTAIAMTFSSPTNGTRQRASQLGIMGLVGLHRNEQVAITLSVPVNWANSPVGIAPLDGGEVIGSEDLHVDSGGTVGFSFKGGDIPGFYRVLVTIASEQYRLEFYVVRSEPDGCIPP